MRERERDRERVCLYIYTVVHAVLCGQFTTSSGWFMRIEPPQTTASQKLPDGDWRSGRAWGPSVLFPVET